MRRIPNASAGNHILALDIIRGPPVPKR